MKLFSHAGRHAGSLIDDFLDVCRGHQEFPRTLGARYENITIPKGVFKIFTTNKPCEWPYKHIFPMGSNDEQHQAIKRRFRVVHINEPLFNAAPEAPAAGGGLAILAGNEEGQAAA